MESTTNEITLQQLIQINERMDQMEALLTSMQDSNSTLPRSIENVLNVQLQNMLDRQQKMQDTIQNAQERNAQITHAQLEKTLDIQEHLGKKADEVITQKSISLFNTLEPHIGKARALIDKLSVNISDKIMDINAALIQINDKLISIHIGKAIGDYVLIGLICLSLGLFGTLRITQVFYGKIFEHSYKAKLELVQKQAIKEYKEKLVKNDSGYIEILELEKEYIQKHRQSFGNPEDCIQILNKTIKQYKESQ